MTASNAAGVSPLVSRERYANAISDALRLYVGRGRRYSVKQLSNATGVKDRVIECAMTNPESVDHRALPGEALLSIALFLGSDFTNEWLKLSGQGAFDFPDEDDPRPGDIALASAENNAEIARAAADGHFCDDDKRKLAVVGRRKIETGMRLVAAGRRAA